jgi:hypothetical protein
MADLKNLDPEYAKELAAIMEKAGASAKEIQIALENADKAAKKATSSFSKWNNEASKTVRNLREAYDIQEDIKTGTEAYIRYLKKAKSLDKEINYLKKQQEAAEGDVLAELKEQTAELEKQRNLIVEQLKNANKASIATKDIGKAMLKGFANIPNSIEKYYGKLKGLGLFEMDKAIRNANLSMGLMGKGANAFRADIHGASADVIMMGGSIQEMAEMQANYGDELGRNVMLGQQGQKAMFDMAKGTNLGAQAAAKFGAEMTQQGFSAERTRDFMQQTMNDAHKMGLNASKVIKNITQNIKLLNKYNFKGGVKGLEKMALTVSKLGVDMDTIAPMADKLWDVEGAVDMSAQLQVLGGRFSALADPFKLMFEARNNPEQLLKDVAKAGADSFKMVNGELTISSYEISRLKEVAKATGIEYDKLATASKNVKLDQLIRPQIKFDMTEEEKQFLTNTAKFNEQGKAYIEVNGKKEFLSELSDGGKQLIDSQIAAKKTLEDNAKSAQTFDEQIGNLINMIKADLLPMVQSMADNFKVPLENFVKRFKEEHWGESIMQFAKTVGSLVASLAGWVVKNPIIAGFAYGAMKLTGFLFEKANWFSNGLILAQGFNAGTTGSGAAGAGGGVMKFAGSFARIAGPLLGIGIGTMLGLSSGKSLSKKAGYQDTKTGTGMGIAGGILGGAGGWALGAALAPETFGLSLLIPLIAAGLGAYGGSTLGKVGGDALASNAPAPSARINDGVIFNKNDKFTKVNDGTMIAGTNENGNKSLANAIMSSVIPGYAMMDYFMNKPGGQQPGSKSTGSSDVHHKFDNDIKIDGQIQLVTSGNIAVAIGDELLKTSSFVRDIARMINSHNKNYTGVHDE